MVCYIVQDSDSWGRHRMCHLSNSTRGLCSVSLCLVTVSVQFSCVPGCGDWHKEPEACFPSSLQFLSPALSSEGQGWAGSCFWWDAPDVNWAASLSVPPGTFSECVHDLRELEPHTFSSVCIAHEGISLYLSNSEVVSVRWLSETHFSNAENFTETLPVLYPSSALGQNHKEVSAGGHRAGWWCWCSLALGPFPSWFLWLFEVCGNLGSITQCLISSM